jgi:putative Mg2+ transporter-C (MgtC) family protein
MGLATANWTEVANHVADISVAYVLALPIGWDRERYARSAGIRTFPLVAVASCGLVLVALRATGASAADQSRILQGLITGIGFIGGGAILKTHHTVRGTATAASIWNVGVIGAAVGYGLYDIAAVLSLINFLTLRLLRPFKSEPQERSGSEREDEGG